MRHASILECGSGFISSEILSFSITMFFPTILTDQLDALLRKKEEETRGGI